MRLEEEPQAQKVLSHQLKRLEEDSPREFVTLIDGMETPPSKVETTLRTVAPATEVVKGGAKVGCPEREEITPLPGAIGNDVDAVEVSTDDTTHSNVHGGNMGSLGTPKNRRVD